MVLHLVCSCLKRTALQGAFEGEVALLFSGTLCDTQNTQISCNMLRSCLVHHKRPENPVRATGLKWFATNTFRSICCHLRLFQIHPTRVPRLTLFRCRSFRFLVETIQEKYGKIGKPWTSPTVKPSLVTGRTWLRQETANVSEIAKGARQVAASGAVMRFRWENSM